jgi:DNA-binding GntR family transcriptional regulator
MLRRDTVRDQIKRVLLTRILDGTYRPGDRLLEMQIARELNASQAPVREALRELEALRLVETQPYRGTRVRAVNAQELREAYQVRAVLEEMAARTAAPNFKGNTGALQAEVNALRTAARAHDLDAYAAHNLGLHRMIVQAAGNSILLRVWESLDLEARARIALARVSIDLREAAESHQAIVDAFNRGDGRTAGRLLREHANACGKHVTEVDGIPGPEGISRNERPETGRRGVAGVPG